MKPEIAFVDGRILFKFDGDTVAYMSKDEGLVIQGGAKVKIKDDDGTEVALDNSSGSLTNDGAEIGGGLPDYSGASEGDALVISDGDPAWQAPSGGGSFTLGTEGAQSFAAEVGKCYIISDQITVTLPEAPAEGSEVLLTLISANTFGVIVAPSGSDTLSGNFRADGTLSGPCSLWLRYSAGPQIWFAAAIDQDATEAMAASATRQGATAGQVPMWDNDGSVIWTTVNPGLTLEFVGTVSGWVAGLDKHHIYRGTGDCTFVLPETAREGTRFSLFVVGAVAGNVTIDAGAGRTILATDGESYQVVDFGIDNAASLGNTDMWIDLIYSVSEEGWFPVATLGVLTEHTA